MTSANIHSQKILILDFGSQYTQLIARRVRELGVYCEIWDYTVDKVLFDEFAPRASFSLAVLSRLIRRTHRGRPSFFTNLGCLY